MNEHMNKHNTADQVLAHGDRMLMSISFQRWSFCRWVSSTPLLNTHDTPFVAGRPMDGRTRHTGRLEHSKRFLGFAGRVSLLHLFLELFFEVIL